MNRRLRNGAILPTMVSAVPRRRGDEPPKIVVLTDGGDFFLFPAGAGDEPVVSTKFSRRFEPPVPRRRGDEPHRVAATQKPWMF